eukprot:572926-Lingulodinium_polyedra.AAC.1
MFPPRKFVSFFPQFGPDTAQTEFPVLGHSFWLCRTTCGGVCAKSFRAFRAFRFARCVARFVASVSFPS